MSKKLRPPGHLTDATKQFWRLILRDFALEPAQLRIFLAACEAWDVRSAAREQIARDGMTFSNRHGEIKPHPAVAIERDARTSFARLIRELALEGTEPAPESRPPRPRGRYQGRS